MENMELTGWTHWKFSNDFIKSMAAQDGLSFDLPEPRYTAFSDAISKLRRPMPRIYTKRELEGKSEKEIEELAVQLSNEWKAYEMNPFIKGKEEEARALQNYQEQCYKKLVSYCIAKRVYISPDEHQNAEWGVPVFDNTYVIQLSLRSWAGLMAEVWNEIMSRTDLTYLDFYCNDADKVIKDYKKPSEVM